MKSKRTKKSTGILVTIVLTMVLGISQLPAHTYAAEEAPATESDRIIVSLGDSYSSGEGVSPFYGKSDFYTMMEASDTPSALEDFDFLAHRSEKAWPGQLKLQNVDGTMAAADNRGTHWFFAAVSGAEIRHLSQKQPKRFRILLRSSGTYLEDSISLPPQLDVFDDPRLEGKKIDYITVTIGGNDVGFEQIVTQCALESLYLDSGKLQQMLQSGLKTTKEDHVKNGIDAKLEGAYRAIHERAPEATILVVGYPHLFYSTPMLQLPNGKMIRHPLFREAEARMVNGAIDDFNDIIESVVKDCQKDMNIRFVPVADAFGDHGAYDIDPKACCMNGLMETQGNDLMTLYDGIFVNWMPENVMEVISDYSFHPNSRGVDTYARCVQDAIDALESQRFPG